MAQKPSYSRNSREVKFPSSTWMHHQQQQRLLLWRSLQSRSHVNSLQSVGTVRSLQVSPQSAVLKPPHHVWSPDYLRPAETRTAPQRPAETRREFWPVSFRRVCSERCAAGTDSSLCSVKFCWCQTEVLSDVQDLFLIHRTEPEVRSGRSPV